MSAGDGGVFWALGDAMRAIPGPTDAWADIVGHLAWPVTLLLVLRWYRVPIASAVKALAARVKTDDVKVGNLFEVSKQEEVVSLADASEGPADGDDAVTEQLLEAVANEGTSERLLGWIAANVPSGPPLDAFLGGSRYVRERSMALNDLKEKHDG